MGCSPSKSSTSSKGREDYSTLRADSCSNVPLVSAASVRPTSRDLLVVPSSTNTNTSTTGPESQQQQQQQQQLHSLLQLPPEPSTPSHSIDPFQSIVTRDHHQHLSSSTAPSSSQQQQLSPTKQRKQQYSQSVAALAQQQRQESSPQKKKDIYVVPPSNRDQRYTSAKATTTTAPASSSSFPKRHTPDTATNTVAAVPPPRRTSSRQQRSSESPPPSLQQQPTSQAATTTTAFSASVVVATKNSTATTSSNKQHHTTKSIVLDDKQPPKQSEKTKTTKTETKSRSQQQQPDEQPPTSPTTTTRRHSSHHKKKKKKRTSKTSSSNKKQQQQQHNDNVKGSSSSDKKATKAIATAVATTKTTTSATTTSNHHHHHHHSKTTNNTESKASAATATNNKGTITKPKENEQPPKESTTTSTIVPSTKATTTTTTKAATNRRSESKTMTTSSDKHKPRLSQKTFSIFSIETPQPCSKSGKKFEELYTLEGVLGTGAFSTVREGHHCSTGDVSYAVKCVNRKKLSEEDEAALLDEVAILKEMKHVHIIRLYDFFVTPDTYYLVMERMSGGELFDRIVAKAYYNEREARDVCKILIEAVGYCHYNQVAHRDLKPENLLLLSEQDDSAVKIADFGFAKKVLEPSSLKTQCGTPGYVAPEILEGILYDTKCDMWSVGVILYILLGGYPPFIENNQRELFRKIRKGDYEFHPEYWQNVSSEAKDLISSLLTVDPAKRLDAEQALENEWIRQDDDTLETKDLGLNLAELKKFNAKRKFKAAVYGVMASNKLQSLGQDFQRNLS